MVDKPNHPSDKQIKPQQHDDPIADLINCIDSSSGAGAPKAKATDAKSCNLPSVDLSGDTKGTQAVFDALHNTTLLGAMSWVHPDQVIGALRDAHPTDAAKFEASYNKLKGGDLRKELKEQLGEEDYRTAIAILENREYEKTTADSIEQALKQTSWHGIFSAPDVMAVESGLSSMDPKQLAQFDKDFSKNEGDDVSLRGELKKYLGADDYKQVLSLIEPTDKDHADAKQEPPTGTIKPPLHASLKEQLASFHKLNAALANTGITGITDIDPRQVDERAFKADYVAEVTRVGKQYGLGPAQLKDVVSGVYALETDGWGTNFTTANMGPELLRPEKEADRFDFHPSSSAIGYNQILTGTTMEIVQKHRADIVQRLEQEAHALPPSAARAKELDAKAQMIGAVSDVIASKTDLPNGMSKKEFTEAVQALNMDKDIGPLIQAEQVGSLLDWYTKRPEARGAASVREMLEQTATRLNTRATVYDHLPAKQRVEAISKIITLAQPTKAEHDTAAHLLKQLKTLKPGLAGRLDLTPPEKQMLNLAEQRAQSLWPQDPARLLLTKLAALPQGKMTVEKLLPAALEMANLAGQNGATGLLRNPYQPTDKYFSSAGLSVNTIARNKSGESLLTSIYSNMLAKRSHNYVGNADLRAAFDRLRRS